MGKPQQQKKEIKITKAGRALWPKLTEPDTKFKDAGEYSVKLVLPEADVKEYLQLCEEIREQAIEACITAQQDKTPKLSAERAREKVKPQDFPIKAEEDPETGEETGNYIITFKMAASGVSKKTGKAWSRRPALFDAQKKPINPKGISIWNGSLIKVAFFPSPWHNPKLECGCSFKLEAVQIIELVNGGSRDYDFGEEEGGYSYEDQTDGGLEGGEGDSAGSTDDGSEDF